MPSSRPGRPRNPRAAGPLLFPSHQGGPMFRTDGTAGVDRPPVAVAFGCGVDSTALCLGLAERALIPDAVVMADTGGEKPETYRFLFLFDAWLALMAFRSCPACGCGHPATTARSTTCPRGTFFR